VSIVCHVLVVASPASEDEIPAVAGSGDDDADDADAALGVDGRRARRDQNRRAVVDALVSLYEEGDYEPTAAEVARRAGLSPRSLFRYFDDVADLSRAAVAHHARRVGPMLSVEVRDDDPLEYRVAELVRRRLELWEHITPSARVARMRAPVVPMLAVELRRNRAIQRSQAAGHLAPELAALPDGGRQALAAIDLLLSFESFEMLRHDQGIPRDEVIEILEAGIRKLLA
jgi:AcrR family transcriptional regulator